MAKLVEFHPTSSVSSLPCNGCDINPPTWQKLQISWDFHHWHAWFIHGTSNEKLLWFTTSIFWVPRLLLGQPPPGNASISRIRVSTSCPSRRRCSWTACHRVTVSPRLAWDGPFGMHIFMEVEIDAGNSDGNYGSFDHLWSNHPTKPTFVDWWSDGPRIRNQICVLMTILDYCFFDLWDTHTRVNFNFWSRPSNDL